MFLSIRLRLPLIKLPPLLQCNIPLLLYHNKLLNTKMLLFIKQLLLTKMLLLIKQLLHLKMLLFIKQLLSTIKQLLSTIKQLLSTIKRLYINKNLYILLLLNFIKLRSITMYQFIIKHLYTPLLLSINRHLSTTKHQYRYITTRLRPITLSKFITQNQSFIIKLLFTLKLHSIPRLARLDILTNKYLHNLPIMVQLHFIMYQLLMPNQLMQHQLSIMRQLSIRRTRKRHLCQNLILNITLNSRKSHRTTKALLLIMEEAIGLVSMVILTLGFRKVITQGHTLTIAVTLTNLTYIPSLVNS